MQHRSARGLTAVKAGRPRPRLVALGSAVLGGSSLRSSRAAVRRPARRRPRPAGPPRSRRARPPRPRPRPSPGTIRSFVSSGGALAAGALALPAIAAGWKRSLAEDGPGCLPQLRERPGPPAHRGPGPHACRGGARPFSSDLSGHYRVTVFDLPGQPATRRARWSRPAVTVAWLARHDGRISALTVGLAPTRSCSDGVSEAKSSPCRSPSAIRAWAASLDPRRHLSWAAPKVGHHLQPKSRAAGSPPARRPRRSQLSTLLFPPTPSARRTAGSAWAGRAASSSGPPRLDDGHTPSRQEAALQAAACEGALSSSARSADGVTDPRARR